MNTEAMHEVELATQEGKMTFPQVVGKLVEIGVESYLVDFAAGRKTCYLASGETYAEPMILKLDPVAAEFSADGIVAAIRAAQADAIRYPEFVKRATAAGVVGYWAFLAGRKVVYFGRKGESHTEEFPKPKSQQEPSRGARKTMSTAVTLSVQISRPAEETFRFLADPATMPEWAIHNVRSIRPLDKDVWEIETPRGAGRFIPHFQPAYGILDHEFADPKEGPWSVSARIVQAGTRASMYTITLVKPAAMPDEAFTQGLSLVEDELKALKRVLENTR
ncbi:MAG: DUF1398 family protein [Terracidiphilus sp.]